MSLSINLIVMGWASVAFATGFPMGNDIKSENAVDPVATSTHERKSRNVVSYNEEEDSSVQGLPRFLFMRSYPRQSVEAQLQSKVTLECEAAGSPAPSMHWLKNGIPVNQDSTPSLNDLPEVERFSQGLSTTKSRLFIDCMSPSDQAEYTCVADTPFQSIYFSTKVYVSPEIPNVLKPSCLPQKKSMSHATGDEMAKIHMWSTQLLQNIGTDAILFCRVTGAYAPTVKWSVNDEGFIRNDERYHILRNGDLLIRKITWNDMGEYTCMASSGHGGVDDSVTTFLYPMANENDR